MRYGGSMVMIGSDDYEITVDTTTSDDATTSGGVRNEGGDKAVASVASNDATIGKVPSRGATTPRYASSTRDRQISQGGAL